MPSWGKLPFRSHSKWCPWAFKCPAQASIQLFQSLKRALSVSLYFPPPSPSQSCFLPSPPSTSGILLGKCSLFCQGDLFNHLIFWWPFIPCYHGYGPIKRRSNKAASQTGNKNIKAMCVSARRGRRRSETQRGPRQRDSGVSPRRQGDWKARRNRGKLC